MALLDWSQASSHDTSFVYLETGFDMRGVGPRGQLQGVVSGVEAVAVDADVILLFLLGRSIFHFALTSVTSRGCVAGVTQYDRDADDDPFELKKFRLPSHL